MTDRAYTLYPLGAGIDAPPGSMGPARCTAAAVDDVAIRAIVRSEIAEYGITKRPRIDTEIMPRVVDLTGHFTDWWVVPDGRGGGEIRLWQETAPDNEAPPDVTIRLSGQLIRNLLPGLADAAVRS